MSATPILIERARNDAWWSVTTIFNVAAGMTDTKIVLASKTLA